jgi:peptidoglycan DL-endopeptidase LytF
MSRRDTIIIAVLLNAGLLIVLFATSLRSDKTDETAPAVQVLASNEPEVQPAAPIAQVAQSTKAAPGTDQIDQVIKQYVTPQVNAGETQPNFLADLQAIGTGQAPTQTPTMEVAPPVAVEQQPAAPTYREVKVKKGDVLERIARQNQVSVEDIMKANRLSSTRLKIGQTLKIPGKSSKRSGTATASSEGAQFYTIKTGDSPWTIAVKHHMKVEELLKLNHMDEAKARRLKPGDKLRVQ